MSDPQDRAEALDEDVVDIVDDITGDEYGEGLPTYPPDRPLGVDPPASGEVPTRHTRPGRGSRQLVEPDVRGRPRGAADRRHRAGHGQDAEAAGIEPD